MNILKDPPTKTNPKPNYVDGMVIWNRDVCMFSLLFPSLSLSISWFSSKRASNECCRRCRTRFFYNNIVYTHFLCSDWFLWLRKIGLCSAFEEQIKIRLHFPILFSLSLSLSFLLVLSFLFFLTLSFPNNQKTHAVNVDLLRSVFFLRRSIHFIYSCYFIRNKVITNNKIERKILSVCK